VPRRRLSGVAQSPRGRAAGPAHHRRPRGPVKKNPAAVRDPSAGDRLPALVQLPPDARPGLSPSTVSVHFHGPPEPAPFPLLPLALLPDATTLRACQDRPGRAQPEDGPRVGWRPGRAGRAGF